MPALTDQQEAAAARRRGSLLLSAGAGSGKTSVLVERFVRAVHEDGIAPSRILAITFTDRAAAELRERVRARLRELGDRELARDSERAPIGTVHSFCARILRAHAVAVGLDPGFAVLDEARAADLRERAFVTGLRAFLHSAGEPAVDLLAAYGPDRLQDSIVAVYDLLRSRGERTPRLPPWSGRRADAGLATGAGPGLAAGRRLVGAASAARQEIVAALAAAARPEGGAERALAAIARVDALVAAAERGDPPRPAACATLALPAGNGSLAGAACGAYREAVEAFSQACADSHAREALALLGALLRCYDEAYVAAKRGRGSLDFDDLEIEATRLLARDDVLRRAWAERFELVMVDEFQDTNPRQLQLMLALERDNLFTVGDEFQSIYGFRHADVALFRERRAALGEREATLLLTHNFRGRPEILEAINAVFAPLFGSDFTPLVAGRAPVGVEHPPAQPLVELLVTDQRGWDERLVDPAGALPAAPLWRQAEARLLAQRIAELVQAGDAVPGETAVLLRATGDVALFARALEEQGVPALVAEGAGFWSAQEVLDCLAYLSTLANPLDDVALYGTLASPFAGVSSDGLALLARGASLGTGTHGAGRAWDSLQRLFGAHGAAVAGDEQLVGLRAAFSAADVAALSAFADFLSGERSIASRRPVDASLRRVVRATGYDAHLLGLPFAERRLANVHKLLRLARDYERGEGGALRGFVDQAERRRASAAREPEAPIADGDGDAVRLMTIHAAKGLEFDVVAIADLGRQGRGDVPDLLVDGDRVGLRLQTLDGPPAVPTLAYASLLSQRAVAEAAEERRILYVAMTRARERLLLSGAVNPERWPAARAAGPPLGWLGPALAEDLAERLSAAESVTVLHPPGAPHVSVRCSFNAPDTVGTVLREQHPGRGADPPAFGASAGPPDTAQGPVVVADEAPGRADRTLAVVGGGRADESPGAVAGPDALSYTALTEFERCGYRYYLERVLGLPADERSPATTLPGEPAGALSGRVRGTLVHRLLETVDFRGAPPSGRGPVGPPEELVVSLARDLGASPQPDEVSEIARLVVAVADTELGARLASAPRVWREHPFAFSLGDDRPLMTGVVDLIAHELGGGCLIVDYKSDRVGAAELAELTERDYGIQRRVYGLAALRGGALTVDVVHWYLQRPTEPVTVRYTDADAQWLVAGLRERVAAVSEGHFPVSDRPHRELCLTCPGRRALCSHPPSLTLRIAPPVASDGTRRDGEQIVARSGGDPLVPGRTNDGTERP